MRKRHATPFSLAFLDIMFCGFGAVVLLVILLNGEVLTKRQERQADLRADLARATKLVEFATTNVAELTRQVDETRLEQGDAQLEIARLEARIDAETGLADRSRQQASEREAALARLERQTTALESTTSLLESRERSVVRRGQSELGFSGDGRRQYLTGLELGGDRTLILVDASASMLDETVVNVLRRRILGPEERRAAPKWQRAVRSVHWLIANLRADRQFQIYWFNTRAQPLVAGTDGRWLDTNNAEALSAAVTASRELAPEEGTNLLNAFRVIESLNPRPDSVVLITDGLPTQSRGVSKKALVSADERLEHFAAAAAAVPQGVSVNTFLFPMEGDPAAAAAFWGMAITTRGSFITPARDWP